MNNNGLETVFFEADHLMQIRDYKSAIRLLLKYRKKYTGNSLLSYNLGVVYYKSGRFIKSIYLLEEAVRQGADEPEVFNQLGLACDRNGDKKGAEAYYIKALEKDPGFAMAWNNLGVLYFLAGDYLTAKYNFEKALEADDSDPDAWFNLRDTYSELGMTSEAEEADIMYHELLRH